MKRPSLGKTIILCTMLAIAMFLVLFVSLWHRASNRAVQAQIDAAHARGEAIEPADFQPPSPIPDDQNAAMF